MAKQHVFRVDNHLVACFRVLDPSINRELAILRISKWHKHLLNFSSINDWLQDKSCWRETIVIQVEFKVRVETLIVEGVVYFLFAALEFMIAKEDKFILPRCHALSVLAFHELRAIVCSSLLFSLQCVVEPEVKWDGQAVLDHQGRDQQVVEDAFVASRLFSEYTISPVVLPYDVLVAVKPVFDSRDLELFRPLLATFGLDANLELLHDVLVTVVGHGNRISWLHRCLVQHESLFLGLAVDYFLLDEELLHLIGCLGFVDQHMLSADGQDPTRVLLKEVLDDKEFTFHVLSDSFHACSSRFCPNIENIMLYKGDTLVQFELWDVSHF